MTTMSPVAAEGSPLRPTDPVRSRNGIRLYAVLLVLNALDAYAIGPIPLQWIMQFGTIVTVGYIALRYRLPRPVGYRTLWIFGLWSGVLTVTNSAVNEFAPLMSSETTTPYPLFILLRLLALLSFIADLYLVTWILREGGGERLIRVTVGLGTVFALAAIYIYIAQLYGLPQLPRTRLGTGNDLQGVAYTYDFHRATGTFREPSVLAAWLIVPFFLCFTVRSSLGYLQAIVVGGAVLLSGSLAGILAIALGLGGVTIAACLSDLRSLGTLFRAFAIVPFALIMFYVFAVSNTKYGVDLFTTLGNRLEPMVLNGGMEQSNRNYIYEYVARTAPPLLGSGLGNANLLLSQYLGARQLTSFISLYLSALYGTGWIGFGLLVSFLVTPVLRIAGNRCLRRDGQALLLLAPYLAWLVIFGVSSEEFTLMFAIASALLSAAIIDLTVRPTLAARRRSARRSNGGRDFVAEEQLVN